MKKNPSSILQKQMMKLDHGSGSLWLGNFKVRVFRAQSWGFKATVWSLPLFPDHGSQDTR